jgi:hypothetical protein
VGTSSFNAPRRVAPPAPELWQKAEAASSTLNVVRLESVTRFWIAVLLAPIGGCALAAGLFGVTNGFSYLLPGGFASGLLGGLLMGMGGLMGGSVFGVTLGWPLMLIFGLPYSALLTRRGQAGEWTLTLGFTLLGALVGCLIGLSPLPTTPGMAPMPPIPITLSLPWCALAGAVTGWLFWYIRK